MRKPRRFEMFNSIPLFKPKRALFNLSNENKLSTDPFRLTPFLVSEGLPDDVARLKTEIFCRTSPLLAPMMHRYDIRAYYFFVPTRIIWDDFEKWINPKSGVTDIVAPRIHVEGAIAMQGLGPKTLADYLGVNFGLDIEDQSSLAEFSAAAGNIFPQGFDISSLPFRAYQQIYNDWFIDLNNMEPAEFSKGSGVEVYDSTEGAASLDHDLYNALMKLRYRAWQHDYFTTAMPEPQRGEDVMAFEGGADGLEISAVDGAELSTGISSTVEFSSPAGTFADLPSMINAHPDYFGFADETEATAWITAHGNELADLKVFTRLNGAAPTISWSELSGKTGTMVDEISVRFKSPIDPSAVAAGLQVSQSGTAAGVTVEELRTRMQMQSFLERNEVAGSRYTELLYAHWGVKSPDGRLQRSEFLGGFTQPIQVNEVTQFSESTDDDPMGSYAGQGVSAGRGRYIKYRVPEHGYIIGLLAVVPRSSYHQGLHPMWKRFDRLDYYWPEFAHLGEQEVKNYEVMFQGLDENGVFGYQQRYAEYKARMDEVHGDFKGNLAFWHSGRTFQTPTSADDIPKLSEDFTVPQSSNPDDIGRIFPVNSWSGIQFENADHFLLDVYNHFTSARRMPKFVIPRNGS